jgi:DnaJ like chaperone protein
MSWRGKLVGGAFGFMVGGPLGAIIGAALGHKYDETDASQAAIGARNYSRGPARPGPSERHEVRSVFYTTAFSVMGYLCKLDGRVSEAEIAIAQQVMSRLDLSVEQQRNAMRLFNQGKRPNFPLDRVLTNFREQMRNQRSLLRSFLEIQMAAAYADGQLTSQEERILVYVAERLGLSRFEYERIDAYARAGARYRQEPPPRGSTRGSLEEAYAVLKLTPETSADDIKRAYRRLMSQHHPDKLASKGLTDEQLKKTTQRTHEIRQAYERIREARGF